MWFIKLRRQWFGKAHARGRGARVRSAAPRVRQMETRQFEFHPMLPGLGITFMEYLIDPVRIIAHGGDTVYFHSDMILVPDAHLGYFLSYNSLGKNVGGGRGDTAFDAFIHVRKLT